MATVLEKYPTEEQRSINVSLWAKRINEKDSHKEIFLAYGGK
jgi:hypothetical protein